MSAHRLWPSACDSDVLTTARPKEKGVHRVRELRAPIHLQWAIGVPDQFPDSPTSKRPVHRGMIRRQLATRAPKEYRPCREQACGIDRFYSQRWVIAFSGACFWLFEPESIQQTVEEF